MHAAGSVRYNRHCHARLLTKKSEKSKNKTKIKKKIGKNLLGAPEIDFTHQFHVLFLLGDLNFRLQGLSAQDVVDYLNSKDFKKNKNLEWLLQKDELTQLRSPFVDETDIYGSDFQFLKNAAQIPGFSESQSLFYHERMDSMYEKPTHKKTATKTLITGMPTIIAQPSFVLCPVCMYVCIYSMCVCVCVCV